MASLMENLIEILGEENAEYELLVELSNRKTPTIIHRKIDELNAITDEEHVIVGRILQIEKSRVQTLKDIAEVINRDVETLKLVDLVEMLSNRPAEQQALAKAHDQLKTTLGTFSKVNEQNKLLIDNAMEMVAFDLNLLKAMNTAPETANYNKDAFNNGSLYGHNPSGFDAKQ